MEKPIYLDNGTIAPPSSHMVSQMQPFIKRHWQAVTAPYLKGKEPFTSIERGIGDLRALVGAHPKDRFLFTSSGGAAISEVHHSFCIDHVTQHGKNHILTTTGEEAPIPLLEGRLEKLGVYYHTIPLNKNGQVTCEALEKALSPKTGLVSLSWANSLTGVIHPIWELAEMCQKKGVFFHVDASHVIGKLYFKFEELPLDYLTLDGPTLHGPKGSGALFVSQGRELSMSTPEGMEGGGLNTPALIGLAIAAEELSHAFDHLCMETARLRDKLEEGIQLAIPDVKVLYKDAERLPNVTALSFPGVQSELLLFHLREAGVFASFGGGQKQTLHHLTGDPCALSFSLSRETTEEEIDRAIGIVVDCAQRCRTFSKGVLV